MDLEMFCEVAGRCLQSATIEAAAAGGGGGGGARRRGDDDLSPLDFLMMAVAIAIVSRSVLLNIGETSMQVCCRRARILIFLSVTSRLSL